jgi:hypothetical protein
MSCLRPACGEGPRFRRADYEVVKVGMGEDRLDDRGVRIRRFRELWTLRVQTSTSTEHPPPAADASRETSEPCRYWG